MGQNVWEGVGGAIAIEGTYAKGYVLNFTASENVEFKCEGRRKEEVRLMHNYLKHYF